MLTRGANRAGQVRWADLWALIEETFILLANAGYLLAALIVAATLYVVLSYNRLVRAWNML
jgi:hypothetical protein